MSARIGEIRDIRVLCWGPGVIVSHLSPQATTSGPLEGVRFALCIRALRGSGARTPRRRPGLDEMRALHALQLTVLGNHLNHVVNP